MSPYVFSPAKKIEVRVDGITLTFDGVTKLEAGEDIHIWVGTALVGMAKSYTSWRII